MGVEGDCKEVMLPLALVSVLINFTLLLLDLIAMSLFHCPWGGNGEGELLFIAVERIVAFFELVRSLWQT